MHIPMIIAFVLAVAGAIIWMKNFNWLAKWFQDQACNLLWIARDELFDAKLQGLIPKKKEVGQLIRLIESLISNIRTYTPAVHIYDALYHNQLLEKQSAEFWDRLLSGLTVEEKKIVEACRQQMVVALLTKIWLGSRSGLFIIALPLFLNSLARAVYKKTVSPSAYLPEEVRKSVGNTAMLPISYSKGRYIIERSAYHTDRTILFRVNSL